jgi:cytochrome d ubiquinol oxidase subunit I
MDAYRFWVKVFALSFAMGVVSGITMSPSSSAPTGRASWKRSATSPGRLLAYEVLTAFFLEAVFLGIMLFGFSPRVRPMSSHAGNLPRCLRHHDVGLLDPGAEFVDAHPAGLRDPIDGQSPIATDWLADRVQPVHALPPRSCAAGEFGPDGGFPGGGPLRPALALRRPRSRQHACDAEAPVSTLGAVLIPLQIYMPATCTVSTRSSTSPQKVAAMEGNCGRRGPRVPLILFAIPDEEARENRMAVEIPGLASLILTHEWDGELTGLNDFVTDEGEVLHPPVAPVFWSFRVMVGTGVAMLLVSWASVWFMWRRRHLHEGRIAGHWLTVEGLPKPILWALVPMAFSGWVATLAGWYTTEIGRQPWLVQGVMTTEMAVAEVPAPMVMGTLATYLAIYAALLFAYVGVVVYLARKAARGHDGPADDMSHSGKAQVAAVSPAE